LNYDPDNIYWNRVKDIYRAGMERWAGKIIMGMPDLGGVMDVVHTFRPGERLLFDLLDKPEEVQRLVAEVSALWHRYFNEISELLNSGDSGYTDWSGLYSKKPGYILQCDFCYMISPDMFRRFILEELRKTCRRLPQSAYHLDGEGALRHLPDLLSIEELPCIQFTPGDGKKPFAEWLEVYCAIAQAGKLIYFMYSSPEVYETILKNLNGYPHVYIPPMYMGPQDKDHALKYMQKFGVI